MQLRHAALTATLGLAAASWVVAVRQMSGMEMGVATRLGSFAAGAVAIAAGVYEFTPLKQHCRRRSRESVRSGFEFGLYCVGSSIGLTSCPRERPSMRRWRWRSSDLES